MAEKYPVKFEIPKLNFNNGGIIPHKVILKAVGDIEREIHKDYISKHKVIFNPPATILITPDGKKYVSKAHNEEFDEEKGLLMCLAKANGITHLELKRMIANAQRQERGKNE